MSSIVPFKGLRFNRNRISFISRVVAPPYDIIDADKEEELETKDEHNIVRLTMGKTPPAGRPEEAYETAAALLSKWRDKSVLVRDETPSIYIVEQTFSIGGEEFTRWGFVAGVLLEELGEKSVYPHEMTTSFSRSDRYKLVEACDANLSQVMFIYSDPDGKIDQLVAEQRSESPIYSFCNSDDAAYRVWQVEDKEWIYRLVRGIQSQDLVIADGHHRYESAFNYSRENRSEETPLGSNLIDYVPGFCISVANHGLQTLPTHRQVHSKVDFSSNNLVKKLQDSFDFSKLNVRKPETIQHDFDHACADHESIACILPDERNVLLTPTEKEELRSRFPDTADSWWELPVSILHYVVFPDVLSIEPGSDDEAEMVNYIPDAEEVYWGVESGEFDIGFLLPATKPKDVQRVASSGERLPMKSTYFYPKIDSGLVIYLHEE
ncbi:MAG: DUF1015 domain-containing protein [Planctomycetes bacterium]|nr:DUF1015 domain-containing protein [Planctomycetota bacterium]